VPVRRNFGTAKEGGEELYDDPDSVLTDLLCDLRHYADRESIVFQTCLDRADMHYETEVAEVHFGLTSRPDCAPAGPLASDEARSQFSQRRALRKSTLGLHPLPDRRAAPPYGGSLE